MKVFVAGATGVLGRRAVDGLLRAGHEVTGVARSDEKAAGLQRAGADAARIDVFDAAAVRDAAAGHDVVMNLATHIPSPSKSALPGAWKQNDRLRSEASANLVEAAIAAGAQRYVQESISFFYKDLGSDWIDEDTPIELPDYAASVADAEANARRFGAYGTWVVLRFGMFYGADATHTKTQIRGAKTGVSPFFGEPEGFQSMIHLDDAGSAVVAALEVPPGVYNVVDDEPMTRADAAAVVADALGRKRLRKAPGLLLKAGGPVFAALRRSQRVSNERFRKASSWEPTFPSAREGWPAVVRQLNS